MASIPESRNFLDVLVDPEIPQPRNFLEVLVDADNAQIDVVAVHGLNYTDRENHAKLTWTASNGKMWLKDFLPTQLPHARILLFGYNANVAFKASTAGVDEQAENLLNRLKGKRKDTVNRPIMFICYSLGGLIVKRALVGAKLDETYESIRKLCYGIVFFGTPHQGGNFASLGSIAGSIASLGLYPGNSFSEALMKDSLFSDNMASDFRHQLGDRLVVTFYETLPVGNRGIIVDKKSATFGLPGTIETRLALDANHESLCKFPDCRGHDYEQVGENIKELAEKTRSTGTQSRKDYKERLKVLKWLSEIAVEDHHSFVSSDRLAGTGEWLFKKPEFIEWEKSNSSSILWLHGIAGAGKSKLASSVIDRFQQAKDKDALAYFYCNYKEEDRKDPTCILRAIVKQLSITKYGSTLPLPVLSLYRKREKDGFLSRSLGLDESKDLILELTANFKQTIICIDALDECNKDTRGKLLFALQQILRSSALVSAKSKVKFFVTSRDDDDIVLKLEGTPNVYIRSSDNTSDITYFVETEIESCIREKKLLRGSVEEGLKTRIIRALVEGAHGMFLWVHLQILSICKKITSTAIQQALASLPEGLENTFAEVFARIEDQPSESSALAKKALSLILYAQRPLSSQELIEALNIQPLERRWKGKSGLTEMAILAVCQNLVVFDRELKVLRFAHLSVQDFLREKFEPSYGHMQLAEICLTILCWPNYENKYRKVNQQTSDFEIYSTENWPTHVRLSESARWDTESEKKPLAVLQKEFMRPCSAYERWCKNQRNEGYFETYDWIKNKACIAPLLVACHFGHLGICRHLLNMRADHRKLHWNRKTSLHYAAAQGHKAIVEQLLKKSSILGSGWLGAKRALFNFSLERWVNFEDDSGRTSLLYAAGGGHDEVVKLLLQVTGVDVNCKDHRSKTPLAYAVEGGHDEVVKLLLQMPGVDANRSMCSGQTPLLWAAEKGHDEVVKLLLQVTGVDVNCKDHRSKTPLAYAVEGGHDEVVKLLLQMPGVDANRSMCSGQTPLLWAAEKGHDEMVKLLLQAARVDVNCKDKNGQTPLLCAAERGHDEVVKQLLQAGGDVNHEDNSNRTPLLCAAERGHDEVVKLLLQAGGDVNRKDDSNRTPLLHAVERGHDEVAKQLLRVAGVDVNCEDIEGQTPLLRAVRGEHDEVVKLLLVAGAHVNCKAQDSWSRTPLHCAAEGGHDEIVKLLLQAGGDVNHEDNSNRTPLLCAAERGHDEVVKLLLQAGGDVNREDNSNRTPLLCAARGGHDEVVKLLLVAGADANYEDDSNRTPLLCAARGGHNEVVKLLLVAGVDVNCKSRWGETPLLWAEIGRHDEMVKQLLRVAGVNVNCKDYLGQTPLYYAAERGRDEVVKQLLQVAGVDVNCKDNSNRTPLLCAARGGHNEVVKLLLQVAGVDVNRKDDSNRTPLLYAVERGHDGVVKQLLQVAGVDLNCKDIGGQTPLLWATIRGHDEAVKLLLAAGVDVDCKDDSNRTPLLCAARGGHDEVVKQLLQVAGVDVNCKNRWGETSLLCAAREGHDEVVKQLLQVAGVDVDCKDGSSRTPLLCAAREGHDEVVKQLLQVVGVDVNCKSRLGETPLLCAAREGHNGVVKQLLHVVGVDVNCKDYLGKTPLLWAKIRRHDEAVKLLLQVPAVDIDHKDSYGDRISTLKQPTASRDS